jgi:hypothetical protein
MSAIDYTDFHIDWEGITLLVKWCPSWLGERSSHQIAHLEIYSADRQPLPITETGYRSHFIDKEAVEALGGPVAFTRAWLDEEAASPAWRKRVSTSRQLSLF